jgi:Ricin-type beta-trefoil lectin domain-like
MKTNLSKQKNIPHPADKIKSVALRVGLLAALCALPLHSALASFSNVECKDYYGNAMVSGNTDIAGNTFSNNAFISVTLNNLSNTNGDINVAAAVLEYEPNVGYGVGVVGVKNGASGTLQGITSDSGSWAAGFWSDQIYGDPTIAELIVDNYGTMKGQATNSTGCAFGFHNYNLYGGLNLTNESGATCSGTAKGNAGGIDSYCYYGPINFVNNGTATGTSSGVNGADVWTLGLNLYTFDSTNRAPIYCENNGYISASVTGGQTNHVFGARVWAQGGKMVLINRGTFKGHSWGGALCQANGVYCGGNVGDDWVVNTGQMIGEGGPGWALGVENDGSNNGNSPYIGTINILNSGVISNGVTSGQSTDGIYGGMGIVLWVSPGPTYLTNTATGTIYGGNMGIWAGVYGGPITIYNSGVIYGGGGEAMHLGDGNDTVYLTGSPTVTGVMNGGNGNNSLVFKIDGTLQTVNGNAANSGNNLSSYGLGTSGSLVASGKTYSWQNFNVSGTVAPSDAIPNGTYKFINRNSGKALEAGGNGTTNGTQIQQWSYVGSASQRWMVSNTGGGIYKIIGVQSGKSLDIDYSSGGTANDTKVQLWDSWNGLSQRFTFIPTDSGYCRVSPQCAPGSCVDVSNASTADGAKVHLWQWLNGQNQQWAIRPVDGTYKIINRNSGLALEAPNQWTGNGQQINQWSYYGGASQQWTVTDTGSGIYKIIGVQSGRSLDIYNGLSANGTKVELWDYWNGPGQQWTFNASSGGYFEITSQCAPGSCLDVSGASTANGANVQLWQWWGGANQQWLLQSP